MKVIRKGNSYKERNEVVRLENEVVLFKIVFGMVHGRPCEGFQKNLPYMSSNYSSLKYNRSVHGR
jgi:hypothetical protein